MILLSSSVLLLPLYFFCKFSVKFFLTLNYNLVLVIKFYQLLSFYLLIIFQEEIKLRPVIAFDCGKVFL